MRTMPGPSPSSHRQSVAHASPAGETATVLHGPHAGESILRRAAETTIRKTGRPWSLRAGSLEVRMAVDEAEVAAAQRLRYAVFYREMTARPTAAMRHAERDFDAFDPVADHLLVIDHGRDSDRVVGTYRLMRRGGAARIGRFYSADEYDIACLLAFPGEILELGRSCVLAPYRTGTAMHLLWRAIAAHVFERQVGLMFGCASIAGTDPDRVAEPLAYLHHFHRAPDPWRPAALPERYTAMDRLPVDAIDRRGALMRLPPLIKGYLRLGGGVGDGAVIDPQFDTTDVCIVIRTDCLTNRYLRHYLRQEGHLSGIPAAAV